MEASQLAPWDNPGVSKLPKRTPYLVLKGGRFYFRIRVPDDLRQSFGKKEHTEALGDINKAQADVRAAQLGAHWQAMFLTERHRLGLAPNPLLRLLVQYLAYERRRWKRCAPLRAKLPALFCTPTRKCGLRAGSTPAAVGRSLVQGRRWRTLCAMPSLVATCMA